MSLPPAVCHVVMALLLLSAVAPVSHARPSPREAPLVDVSVQTVGFGSLETPTRVELQLKDAEDATRPAISRLVSVPSIERFQLPEHSTWRVSVAPGCCWAPVRTITVRSVPTTMQWTVVPAASIEGRLATPRGEPLPDTLTVTLLASTKDPLPAEFEGAHVACPIHEDRWRCQVPAGLLDLRLRARSFLSEYRWGVRASRGAVVGLGLLQLRHGASLTGWVRAADGRPLGSSCRVELDVPGMVPDESERATKKTLRTLTANALSNGFFKFEGIATGSYVVTVRHPAYATATLYPVVVEKDTESAVRDPITLERPIDLTVAVDPPQDPQGRPWVVVVRSTNPSDGRRTDVPIIPLASPGRFRSERLSPGSYSVLLRDADRQQLASEEFLLSADSDTVNLRPQLLELRGSVYLGAQPLPDAQVRLESRTGRATVRFHSDDHGEFTGQIPKGHQWRAKIVADSPRVDSDLQKVDVSELETEAELTIHLPENELQGAVVDKRGRGVAAVVEYYNLDETGHSSLRTDASGRFVLRGLPQGQYVVSATAESTGATSEAAQVTFSDTADAATVQLTVPDTTTLTGVVSGSAGPLARTLILGLPKYADGSFNIFGGTQVETGADGAFEFAVPSGARSVDLIMMARGRVLDVATLALPPANTVALGLPDVAGAVHLTWHNPLDPNDVRKALPLLMLRGVILDMPLLTGWVRQHGVAVTSPTTEIEIPNLAPGAYRACFPVEGQAIADWIAGPRGRCVDGQLSAGGTLTLREP